MLEELTVKQTKNGKLPRLEGPTYSKRKGWEEGPRLKVRLYEDGVELKDYTPGEVDTWLERKPSKGMVRLHASRRKMVFPALGVSKVTSFSLEPADQRMLSWVVYKEIYTGSWGTLNDLTIEFASPVITIS